MAKLSFLKRLVKEDFKADQQDMIAKIAFIINPALEAIANAMTNGLTIEDNINGNTRVLTLTVDTNGIPLNSTSFPTGLKSTVQNVIVTRATNLTNSSTYPVSCPFINFSDTGSQVVINQVSGLQANNKYQLRLLYTV